MTSLSPYAAHDEFVPHYHIRTAARLACVACSPVCRRLSSARALPSASCAQHAPLTLRLGQGCCRPISKIWPKIKTRVCQLCTKRQPYVPFGILSHLPPLQMETARHGSFDARCEGWHAAARQLPVGTIVPFSTIRIAVRRGARVRCRVLFGTTNPWRGPSSTVLSSRSIKSRPSTT